VPVDSRTPLIGTGTDVQEDPSAPHRLQTPMRQFSVARLRNWGDGPRV